MEFLKPNFLKPNWTLPLNIQRKIHALSTLRSGGVSQAPYGSFNLGAHVEDDETDTSQLNIGTLVNNIKESGVDGLSEGLKAGIQMFGTGFANNLLGTLGGGLFSNLGKNPGSRTIYDLNFNNTKELLKWALSYGETEDYRDVTLEMRINEMKSKTYLLPDMYAVDYQEKVGIHAGQGIFSIILKQKRYSNRKIEII